MTEQFLFEILQNLEILENYKKEDIDMDLFLTLISIQEEINKHVKRLAPDQ
jgi:hypothetical protein